MMKLPLLLPFFILACSTGFSQFNDTINYYVNFASTGIINKTHEGSAYVLNNSLKLSLYKKDVYVNTSHAMIYGKQRGDLTNRDITSALDFGLFKTFKHFYYWGLGAYERSFSLKINHRLQAGLGVGYNIIDRKNMLVVVSDGILYETSELYDNAEAGVITYDTYRNSLRLKFRLLVNNVITLEGTGFLQHALDDHKDYIVRSNTALSIKLMKWLSFTTTVTYNKLNRTRRENLLINLGLTMERYF